MQQLLHCRSLAINASRLQSTLLAKLEPITAPTRSSSYKERAIMDKEVVIALIVAAVLVILGLFASAQVVSETWTVSTDY